MATPKKRTAYIIVLPSLFTTGNLFCGFYSIIRSHNYDFERAAWAILVAGIFDLLDGRVARITRSQSQFGVEYDSIADVVSFGIAPAFLAYVWVLQYFDRLGLAAAFFFAACGALRLARFNTIHDETPKSYFVGLPIPAAANFLAAAAILYHDTRFEHHHLFILCATFALGALMVSTVRYRSFKDFDLRHRRSFVLLVMLVALVAVAAAKPEYALACVFGYYVAWGPIREAIGLVFRKRMGEKKKGLIGNLGTEPGSADAGSEVGPE